MTKIEQEENSIKIRTWRIAWSWCICCALSNHLRATVHSSDGKIYEQEYEKGKRCIQ
jgi:DNA gyrase/topoisomerase IV subunit B